MSRSYPPLSPELHTLLEWESTIPPLPPSVRARAVERARAAMAMGRGIPVMLRRPLRRIRLAAALTAAVATAAAAGGIGYELGVRYERLGARSETTTHVVVPTDVPYTPLPTTIVAPSSAAAAGGPDARESQPEAASDELLLLGEARSAVADQDFAAALVPINEHARRFDRGVLAEEREALRVRALAGLEQTEEAKRAADAFEARFPHSVLLVAVRGMVGARP